MTPNRHLVVVGLMGSGKTTLGRALAKELGRRFVDSDTALEQATGETAREIADDEGLDRLHVLEAKVLHDTLESDEPSVVASAASTIEDDGARAALTNPDVGVIWLRGTPATLAGRVTATTDGHRPSAALAAIDEQAPRREPLYGSVADITIDVDDLAPRDVVAAAIEALRSRRLIG
ncbi:MAG TPA: shikimate kinase [Candidatus Limnocylindrales bacterium]|jgi:shikimate kinase